MACRTASSIGLLVLVAFTATTSARAQERSVADKNLAQSLFDEGRKLLDEGRFAEACPRFADSQRLDPGGGTVLNLALCYEKLGKLASAYSTYGEAISLAVSERRPERESFARERSVQLAPRVPRLTFEAAHPAAGLEVRVDGTGVPMSTWGTPILVDPGDHEVVAHAPSLRSLRVMVSLKEGESRVVPIELEPVNPPSAENPLRSTSTAVPPPPSPNVEHVRSTAFYILGAASLSSLVASGITGIVAWSEHENVLKKCSNSTGFCSDPSGVDDASRARTLAWASTATLAAGALSGVVAFVLPLRSKIVVTSGAGTVGVAWEGQFPR